MPVNRPEVIVGTSYWTLNGVNVFSANLARGLRQLGIDTHILLTEARTDLVQIHEAPMPRPADVPLVDLPVERSQSWGAHWGATIRYLEDRAPCVYIPNSDWRHSCISPLLSADIRIVGVVHSDDPLHYDHVRRLGKYWDAVVATSPLIAQRTIALDPSLVERTEVIPIGVDVPLEPPERLDRPGGPLRLIYPGTLKQHQKRVLDLPRIVEAARRRRLPVTLTIAGGGPDESLLRAACADLVEQGFIRFLGVVPHADLLRLLEEHDVFVMTSEFEGMPNALLEAMGRGCIPVVSDIESGIRDLVRDGLSGHVVSIGAIEAFADRLAVLCSDQDGRRRMAGAAHAAVLSGRFRVEEMVRSYAGLCGRLMDASHHRTFRRPEGVLSHPPPTVGGESLFPVDLPYEVPGIGAFPSELGDVAEFRTQIGQIERVGTLRPAIQRERDVERARQREVAQRRKLDASYLKSIQVIVASPAWTRTGVNDLSAHLVRQLRARGIAAHILLTEEDSDLGGYQHEPRLPRPADVPFELLPVSRTASWGARWGGMIRYLEDRAPCIYLPNHDWRHSCVCPLLSDRVAVVGVVHGDEAMHHDHVRRLGRFWNVVVAHDEGIARTLAQDVELAPRVAFIPYNLDGIADGYVETFGRIRHDLSSGAFRRPQDILQPPPREVEGIGVFGLDVTFEKPGVGLFPSFDPDYLDFERTGRTRGPR